MKLGHNCFKIDDFGHCFFCSSSIDGFWLPLWYLQTLLARQYLIPSEYKPICFEGMMRALASSWIKYLKKILLSCPVCCFRRCFCKSIFFGKFCIAFILFTLPVILLSFGADALWSSWKVCSDSTCFNTSDRELMCLNCNHSNNMLDYSNFQLYCVNHLLNNQWIRASYDNKIAY